MGLAAVVLSFGVFVQTSEALSLLHYVVQLQKMTVAAPASGEISAAAGLQDRWVKELNSLVLALVPLNAQISSFDFSANSSSVSVVSKKSSDDEIEEVINKTLGRETTKIKEGAWAWRE